MPEQLLTMARDDDMDKLSSSDEEIQVPLHLMHIKHAHDRAKAELKSIKKKKDAILRLEKCKLEKLKNLKKMIQEARTECTETPRQRIVLSAITSNEVPPSLQIPKCRKRFTLHDNINNCYINITIDLTRRDTYYITVQKLLKQLKLFTKKYESVAPQELLHYITKLILEKRITNMLDGVDKKMKYRALMQMYREQYPDAGDEEFVETTLCDIWLGKYNDPIESDCDSNATDKPKEQMDTQIHITVEEICYGTAEWEIVLLRDDPECPIIEDSDSDLSDMEPDQGFDPTLKRSPPKPA